MSQHSPAPLRTRPNGPKLTLAEVHAAYQGLHHLYPPVMTLVQAAALSGFKPSTLKRKFSEGCFQGCARRGKPLRIWRDRFVLALMELS